MALSMERLTETLGLLPTRGTYPIAANTRIFKGAQVGLNASGQAIPATTIAGGCVRVVGKASATIDNRVGSTLGGAAGAADVEVEFGVFNWANSGGGDVIAADDVGKLCYAVDDQTVALTSNGGTRPIAGLIAEFKARTFGGTAVPFVMQNPIVPVFYDTLTILASTANAEGAALIGLEDAGSFTLAATVEAAIAELYQSGKSANAKYELPILSAVKADGTALAKFSADNVGTVGIYGDGTKIIGLRWNNAGAGASDTIALACMVPDDIDLSVAPTLKIKCAKVGATLGDAVTFVCGVYAQTEAAAYDGGANLGATSGPMTGDAVSKTVQLVSATLTAPASNAQGLTITINPTAAKLGTDDVIITHAWLEYTRKLATS